MILNWENIDNYHQRAKIPGGWLVKANEDVWEYMEGRGYETGQNLRVAICFVPDPDHEWGKE